MMPLLSLPRLLLAGIVAGAPLAASAAPTETSPARLSDLAIVPDGGLTETRKVTPIGQYGATRVMELQLKAGSELSAHAAPERVLVIVLGGRGHFDFEGERVPLHERQVLHMHPGETHGVTAETDLDLLLVRIDESAAAPAAPGHHPHP